MNNKIKILVTNWLLGILMLCGAGTQAMASASFVLVNLDSADEGFNDLTPVAAVSGNPGTTLGAQRVNAFNAAMQAWGSSLNSDVPIKVEAKFDPLTCTSTSADLAKAGPNSVHSGFPGSIPNTWYVQALANSIAKSDLWDTVSDISATFNSNLDSDPVCLGGIGWNYEIPSSGNSPSFYSTVLHELGHGLNFISLVDSANGSLFDDSPDIYTTFLLDQGSSQAWTAMTNAERATSATSGDLFWKGPNAKTAASLIPLSAGQDSATQNVEMYAPSSLVAGSSVSHWDTRLTPDELMEPYATPSPIDKITLGAFVDMGWTLHQTEQPGLVNLSGMIKTSGGMPICGMVLASGQFMFSCNPVGYFSLSNLPRETDNTVKLQIYADGFFPYVVKLTDSDTQLDITMKSASCPAQ